MSDIEKVKVDRSVLDQAEKWTAQCYKPETETWFDVRDTFAKAIVAERSRCLTIIQSIETTSAQGMRVIDEIVRKVRGQE